MDSGVHACSQGRSLDAKELETHPFWSSTKTERSENPPPYTDGRSRVVLAHDGTKDCLAVLLTPTLVAALNQITHDISALDRKDGALERIEKEIIDLEYKCYRSKGTVSDPRYQDWTEEMQLALEILQLKQEEAKEQKSKLNLESASLEDGLKFSRYQSQDILEEALREARLLDPPALDCPPISNDIDDDTSTGGSFDTSSMYEGVEATPEQEELRETHRHVMMSYDALRTCREKLHDRQADYEHKLAAFQRASSEDKAECTRTQFDHRHIRHVRILTRDLISAEEDYRVAKAKARAKAMDVSAEAVGDGADGGDRRSEDVADELRVDRERIEAWRRGVVLDGEVGIMEDGEAGDVDGWEARTVEIMDSVSAKDRDEYVDEINEWEEHCGRLRQEML